MDSRFVGAGIVEAVGKTVVAEAQTLLPLRLRPGKYSLLLRNHSERGRLFFLTGG